MGDYDVAFAGQFIARDSIYSRQVIYDFMKTKYFSNMQNSQEIVQKLIKHTDVQNRIKKIYAVQLKIMLPTGLRNQEEHELIKQFMLNISYDFKRICYLYKFVTIGKGRYCLLIAFERRVYLKSVKVNATYKRDMYIDSQTGRTTNKNNPNAIHKCKKGDVKKDENGNVIKESMFVTDKTRHFNYRDGKKCDVETRKRNFNDLINALKAKFIQAMSKVLNDIKHVLKLKNKQYKKTFSKSKKIKILNYNARINKINKELVNIQDAFYRRKVFGMDHDIAIKNFNRIFYNLVGITEKEEFKVSSVKQYKASISLTKHMSFKQLNTNLDLFVSLAERKMDKWLKDYLPVEYR